MRCKTLVDRFHALSIIALILGASGLVIGGFSVINFQIIEGPEGPQGPLGQDGLNGRDGLDGLDGQNGTDGRDGLDGQNGMDGLNGTDGRDAPGGIIIGILDPDYGETLSGNVTIRAIIFGSENYTLSILRNGTEIGTSLPMEWNSLTVIDGWWNITIVATDLTFNNISSDEVIVNVRNFDITYINVMPLLVIPVGTEVYFDSERGVVHNPNSSTNYYYCFYKFIIPDNYVTTENIILHLVWGYLWSGPIIDYRLIFGYSSDGNSPTNPPPVTSSWTGAGQSSRNFETLTLDFLNPGNLVWIKVYLEEQSHTGVPSGLFPVFCYGVWLEVPVE
jgi:hypothetical protein